MKTGRPKIPIILSNEEHAQLKSMVYSRSLPHGLITRARIVLMAAQGATNREIAEKVDLSPQMVCKWRQRYLHEGLSGLHDELRPGRPRSISDQKVAFLVRKTLTTKPRDGTHWTIRSIAKETKLSRPTVHRIWRAFGLQPHRQRHFKLSTDPFFVEKVRFDSGKDQKTLSMYFRDGTLANHRRRCISKPYYFFVFDAARYDYLERSRTSHLDEFINNGVSYNNMVAG